MAFTVGNFFDPQFLDPYLHYSIWDRDDVGPFLQARGFSAINPWTSSLQRLSGCSLNGYGVLSDGPGPLPATLALINPRNRQLTRRTCKFPRVLNAMEQRAGRGASSGSLFHCFSRHSAHSAGNVGHSQARSRDRAAQPTRSFDHLPVLPPHIRRRRTSQKVAAIASAEKAR